MKLWINRIKEIEFDAAEGHTLRELFAQGEIYVDAPCGGRGNCGKCVVRFYAGAPEPLPVERERLSAEALEEGFRLSCQCVPVRDCEIELGDNSERMDVETEFENVRDKTVSNKTTYNNEKHEPCEIVGDVPSAEPLGVAIDLGTTTIAMALVSLLDGRRIKTKQLVNHQRAYGADVISRIQAADCGRADLLKNLVRKDLAVGMEELLSGENGIVKKITIAGNTTMCHLLMGYSCETLGVAPFTPVTIKREEYCVQKEWGEQQVVILPGISAFVGADIVAGVLAVGMDEAEEVSLFLDVGTNSEMVIGNKNGFLATSAAAGPAFEGNSITNGMPGVAGAISHVRLTADGAVAELETVGGEPPKGICGSGILDVMSELVQNKMVDENGTLAERWFETGVPLSEAPYRIRITQADIREIQMAKAAIRAGTELLMKAYGVTADEVETVYLAGGFGKKMDVKSAVQIGMFPPELSEKIVAVGNAALEGAALALCDDESKGITQGAQQNSIKRRAEFVRTHTREINLAGQAEFEERYLSEMGFA